MFFHLRRGTFFLRRGMFHLRRHPRALAVDHVFLFGGRDFLDRGGRPVAVSGRGRCQGLAVIIAAQLIGFIFVDRAGVGNLFSNPELVQLVDDLARLDFQLPRQLIDSNLTHIRMISFNCLYYRRFAHTQGW
jgi:hypothetical protein